MPATKEFELISHHLCPYVQRAAIALGEKGITYRRIDVDLGNKPEWFKALSPLGKTPVLRVGGEAVFESQVIAEFADEITPGSLHPADPLDKARHRSWIEFGSETLNAIAALYNAKTDEAFAEKRAALRAKLKRIEEEVQGPWFAGDRFYLIDGVWGTIFRYFDTFEMDADLWLMEGLHRLTAWRERVATRPSVRMAVAPDYPERLREFLINRDSILSKRILALRVGV